MGDGAALRTYYCPEAPVQVNMINFNLTQDQRAIVQCAKQTHEIGRLELELHAVGHGLVWNLDHFEVIPGQGAAQHAPLNAFCEYSRKSIRPMMYHNSICSGVHSASF